jgi:molybdate transport system substrate-binding protein
MAMPRTARALLPVALAGLLAGGCAAPGAGQEPSTGATPGLSLTIYAAASLTDALPAIASAYRSVEPDVQIVTSTGASSLLRAQIEQGAPADLFLSADERNARSLLDEGLAASPLVPFARNDLALIVPGGNPAGIHSPWDLARAGVRIVAAGPDVPIQRYADQLIANLASAAGAPAQFAARVEANIVSREDDVRAVLAKIALGVGDAGIVYATDAASSAAVEVIPVPASANVPAVYAGVVPRAARHPRAATAFLQWLAGPGSSVLERFGFAAYASPEGTP